jgi:hypothetical protein
MPGAILTIKPHLVWDGEVLNYASWRNLIEKELQSFQTEEEQIFFVASHISCTKMISFIKNCSSTEDMFMCLDAHASDWLAHEVLGDMKYELDNLPSLPENYHSETQNIQALIMYIRAYRKNGGLPYGPRQFAYEYSKKLSERNAKEILKIKEESDDIEDILKFLYNIQRTNNIMQWIPARKRIPVVKYGPSQDGSFMQIAVSKEKAMTSAQKQVMIKSKLSRLRKKFYLRCDENTANEYVREVHKYLRIFKPKRREKEKWERKIQKTCIDIKQPMSENVDKSGMASEGTKLPDQAPPVEGEKVEITSPDGGEKAEISEEAESVPTLCFPEIPKEDPGDDEDPDEEIHRRLKKLKKKVSTVKKTTLLLKQENNEEIFDNDPATLIYPTRCETVGACQDSRPGIACGSATQVHTTQPTRSVTLIHPVGAGQDVQPGIACGSASQVSRTGESGYKQDLPAGRSPNSDPASPPGPISHRPGDRDNDTHDEQEFYSWLDNQIVLKDNMLPKQNVNERTMNVAEKTLLTLLTVMLILMSTMMKKMKDESPMKTHHECRYKKTNGPKKSFAMISLTLCYLKSKIRNRLKIAHQWVMNLLMEIE